MHDILITGAAGTVGREVLQSLQGLGSDFRVTAGVRDPRADGPAVRALGAEPLAFDFADSSSVGAALDRCDALFLLRPPQLADVQRYFAPLVRQARERGVGHIVFLSVQGADRNAVIPHHKIERLLVESGIPYTFLRPAYFLQNFTTTLREDLVRRDRIYLPAGRAKFTIIDVADIGRVAAQVLSDPGAHANAAYDLTNDELLNFGEMAHIFSKVLGRSIALPQPQPLLLLPYQAAGGPGRFLHFDHDCLTLPAPLLCGSGPYGLRPAHHGSAGYPPGCLRGGAPFGVLRPRSVAHEGHLVEVAIVLDLLQ